jgi:hypothetical protein
VRPRVKNLAEKIAVIRERRARCKEMLAKLDRTGESQISLTDPNSRATAALPCLRRAIMRRWRSMPNTS